MIRVPAQTAIAHDWLLNRRGAERLLREFCLGLKKLSIFTLFFDPEAVDPVIRRQTIFVSRLNLLPGVARYYRYLLPLFQFGIRSLKVREGDLLLSISHAVSKGIPHGPAIPHVCYCLTPMRYAWNRQLYDPLLAGSVRGLVLKLLSRRLKRQDLQANEGVDFFVAISKTVQEQIRLFYGRESMVIYPCFDNDLFRPGGNDRENFYLMVSALVPQKRVELAVEAFNQNGRTLLVAGAGPEHPRLARMAKSNVRFLGWVPDEEVRALYQRARALIFPGTEEFGLVPVEAQACGCPVVAYRKGGVTETVVEGETGVFFDQPNAESLIQAVDQAEGRRWNAPAIVDNSRRFSRQRFWSEWRGFFASRIGLKVPGSQGS